MIPIISRSIYLFVYTRIQFSIIIFSNQSTHRIINIFPNHWIQLSTHPIICQWIPSYHLYSNQSTLPIADVDNWSIKSWYIQSSSIPICHFIDSIDWSIWSIQSSISLSNCLSLYHPFPTESITINWWVKQLYHWIRPTHHVWFIHILINQSL